jgi:hypothetical protein
LPLGCWRNTECIFNGEVGKASGCLRKAQLDHRISIGVVVFDPETVFGGDTCDLGIGPCRLILSPTVCALVNEEGVKGLDMLLNVGDRVESDTFSNTGLNQGQAFKAEFEALLLFVVRGKVQVFLQKGQVFSILR